ncbi:elongation factor P [Treponema parvum]|uniref:Elongation factor P n=1 Tax=Treponema parvum TaxID=138851 RepID=A0A975EZ82_9SPIR|nr:elongation factor P [Treponema parvum]QTQ11418.1 elongation factor P [Treponema parvum]QTQ14403.1 elongation factor P [Treponema parvum]QTQ16641.1 elongation factor P [Treponema parvum]
MIRGGEINKGTVLLIKNAPYLVVEREFVNPGKGTAFARCKLKNLKDGSVLSQQVFKTPDMVEDATVETINAQFMYSEPENHIFQNTQTFDQISVPVELNPDLKYYLRDDVDYQIVIWEENPIDVKIPQKMVFTVAESENYVKGDTVSGATKPVTTETGLTVRVPLFIKQNEKIMINTETNEYLERINK